MTTQDTHCKFVDAIRFNQDGLVAVVAQQCGSKEVLMVAWMNYDALQHTLATGEMHYWSRSRQALWRKGESSGQTQRLHRLLVDCDGDTLLAEIEQTGVACHTGRRSCFYRQYGENGNAVTIAEPEVEPGTLYPGTTK